MVPDPHFDKKRGQRMLLTKWSRIYHGSDSDSEKELAAQKIADVFAWAGSVGLAPHEIAEDQDLPPRAFEIFQAGDANPHFPSDQELREAETEVVSAVDFNRAARYGRGAGCVYTHGYACLPDRLKIGRSANDPVTRIASQINSSTPDRPVLYLVIQTYDPGPLERLLHNALILRKQKSPAEGMSGSGQPSTKSLRSGKR